MKDSIEKVMEMKQAKKRKYCDWPEEQDGLGLVSCGQDATHLVYGPEELWLCDYHKMQYHAAQMRGKNIRVVRISFTPAGWVTFEREEREHENVCMYILTEARKAKVIAALSRSGFVETCRGFERVAVTGETP